MSIEVFGSPTSVTAAGYVGGLLINNCNANLTGKPGEYTDHKGGCFGGNSNVFTGPNATNLEKINGHEFDVTLVAGASAASKYGISIVKGSADAVRGTFSDAAIALADKDGAGSWKYGVSFGVYSAQWPFGPDSTLIMAQDRKVGPMSKPVAAYGIDFANVTFGAAPLRMPLMSASGQCEPGAMMWDAEYIYVCAARDKWKRARLSEF